MRRRRTQLLIALAASVFVVVAGILVLLGAAGSSLQALGWLLLVIGLLFGAMNFVMFRRPR